MSYKQHNSPFTNYSDPARVTNKANSLPNLTQGLIVPDSETAEGVDTTTDTTNIEKNASVLDQPDSVTAAVQNLDATSTMNAKLGRIHKRANNKDLTPTQRGRAKRHELNTIARNERQEKKWELKNKLKEDKLAKSNPERIAKIEERQTNLRDKALENNKINQNLKPMTTLPAKTIETSKPRNSITGQYGAQFPDFEIVTSGTPMIEKQPNMKQINSKGSAFPMVNPDGEDPTAIPPNRAGGALDKNNLMQPPSSIQPQYQSANQAAQEELIGRVSSYDGSESLSTDDNSQDQIAQAQQTLGTATNTLPNTMGSSGMGMHGPAKKDWMGNIKDTGECTGANYNDPKSCSGRAKAFATRARSGEFNKK